MVYSLRPVAGGDTSHGAGGFSEDKVLINLLRTTHQFPNLGIY
jgi:hypothetical protein